jgi:hypothetical protein
MRQYFRHPNGGGRVFSLAADVEKSAYVDERSMIGEGARVLGAAHVEHSKIGGTARVFGARILASQVGVWLKDEEGRPFDSQPPFPIIEGRNVTVKKSHVYNEEISSDDEEGIVVTACELYQRVVVRGRAELTYVVASDRARVYGDCAVVGTEHSPVLLNGMMHVHLGVWHTAPRYYELGREGAEGVNVGVTECWEGRVNVGCWCRPLPDWLSHKTWRLPLDLGWTREEVEEVRGVLEQWRDDAN